MEGKPIVTAGCLGVAFALFIAGTVTPVVTASFGGWFKYTITLWTTCTTTTAASASFHNCIDTTQTCDTSARLIRAARAFDILSIAAAGVSAFCAALLAFLPFMTAVAPLARVPWGLMGGAASAVFSLIAFAMTLSLYTEPQCEAVTSYSKSKGVNLGPNAPLYIVGCILCTVPTVVAFFNVFFSEAPKPADHV